MTRARCTALALLLAACSDDPGPCPNHRVRVYAPGFLTLMAVRDGDGPWATPVASDGAGYYDVCVTDDYVVTAACTSESSFTVLQYASTYAEGDSAALGPCGDQVPVPTLVTVTGELAQRGFVSVGSAGIETGGNELYSIDVVPGIYDVVANDVNFRSEGGRIAIRRDFDATAAAIAPTIDLDLDGTLLQNVTLVMSRALVTDQFAASTTLVTAHAHAYLTDLHAGPVVAIVPASILQDGEYTQVSVIASSPNVFREVDYAFTGAPSATLPPVFDGVSLAYAPPRAAWATLPVDDYASLAFVLAGTEGTQQLSASRGWIAAHAATSLEFDTSAPGYDPTWTLAHPGAVSLGLSAVDGTTTSTSAYGIAPN